MKTKKLIATAQLIAVMCISSIYATAQSWSVNGNANIAAGTNYLGTSDPNDLVLRSNAIERGRLLSTGIWRFGTATDNAQIDVNGVLTFNGQGVYQVAGNRYAFQYKNDPDYGLFFNSSDARYEFRNGTAIPLFYIDAMTGAPSIGNPNTNQNYLLPLARGNNNQVLRTNGSGVVSWSDESVVTLSGTNGINVTGTYPNFTINGNNLWRKIGNAGTNPATHFIGTTDGVDFITRTNNVERMRVTSGGNVGIGISAPDVKLHVANGSDVNLAGGGAIVMGVTSGLNLAMDNNEIQARLNGAASVLNLNQDGGSVVTGGALTTGGNVTITGNLDASGTVGFGSVETFSDGGANTIESNSNIIPSLNGTRDLGNTSLQWRNLYITGSVLLTSDLRAKTNIRDMNYGLKQILQLRPVTYNLKESSDSKTRLGVIAQELQKVIPELVADYAMTADENTGAEQKVASDKLSVDYIELIPVLIKAIQEQQQQIDELKKSQGTSSVSQSTPSVSEISTTNVKLSAASLEQNVPNPTRNTTSIRYNIPPDVKNASLIITDMNGKAIKQLTVKAGSGVINIDASSLTSGTYNYTLIVDGRTIETKRMVVAK